MERAQVSHKREERLKHWVECCSDAILRTCFLYLADRTSAEDALQDTFLKAWKHMEEYEKKGVANEKAWLMRIAINTCRDYQTVLAETLSKNGKRIIHRLLPPSYDCSAYSLLRPMDS